MVVRITAVESHFRCMARLRPPNQPLPAAWGTAMTETKPKRRWFRFSLRTLFVVITVICVVVNWKVVPAVQQRQAVSGLKDFAFVSYDYSYESVRTDDKGKPPPEPSWAARVIRVDSVHNVVQVSVSRRNDVHGRLSGLKHLPRLPATLIFRIVEVWMIKIWSRSAA